MGVFEAVLKASESAITNQIVVKTITVAIIIVLGLIVGRFLGKLLLKILTELSFDNRFRRKKGKIPASHIISNTLSYIVYILTLLVVLEYIGITGFFFNVIIILAGAFIIISLLLGAKDFMPNFIAGFTIKKKSLFTEGDNIQVGSIKGTVLKITRTDTRIETEDKDILVVPNSYFLKNPIHKKK